MSSSHYAARVTMDSSIESEDEPPNRYTDQEALKIKHQQIIGYDPSSPLLGAELPQSGPSVSWVNPKLEARTSKTGSGIFALQQIYRGDTLIVWTGKIVDAETALLVMDTPDKHYILQIGDGFYQIPLSPFREPADWTNHSCEPNAGFGKQSPICLSAMKDIAVGEEVTFDYGMCETDPRLWDPMECGCGAEACRGLITANDWKLHPQLWTKYAGFFAPHVQRCIDQLKQELEEKRQQDNKRTASPSKSTTNSQSKNKQKASRYRKRNSSPSKLPPAALKNLASEFTDAPLSSSFPLSWIDYALLRFFGLRRVQRISEQQESFVTV